MDKSGSDKRIRRSALRLVAVSLALGFLIGLAVGASLAYHYTDKIVIVSLTPGVEV